MIEQMKREVQALTCKRDRTSDAIREQQLSLEQDIQDRDALTDKIIELQKAIAKQEAHHG
jgi:hypothetical protein